MLKFLSENLRHYFIPHHTNNYKAKSLHHSLILFYILLLLAFQSFYSIYKKISPNVLGFATDISIEKILVLVNQERQNENLQPLALSRELTVAAEGKADDMFAKNYWAHISPTGTTPWEFITKTGYQYIYAGENLAKSFDNTDEVVKAWMKSPTHRANIMKPEYTEIGLAVHNGVLNNEETTLVVQEFGSRQRPVVASVEDSQKEDIKPPTKIQSPKPFFRINRSISLMIAEFMLVVLLIDSIFIWKHKTIRVSGHSLAHIMFFLALLGAMSATGIGAIL